MSFLTHFYWDAPCAVWVAWRKDGWTLYRIVTKRFLQRCNFAAVDQDPRLTRTEQVCDARCLYEVNMPHCPQLTGELLPNCVWVFMWASSCLDLFCSPDFLVTGSLRLDAAMIVASVQICSFSSIPTEAVFWHPDPDPAVCLHVVFLVHGEEWKV